MSFYIFQVQKQGTLPVRSIDLTRFSRYNELIAELDRMFEFDRELVDPNTTWMVVYTDDEGDMMLVGDDPWQYDSVHHFLIVFLIFREM
jgi:hypothetical protein